MVRFLPDFPLRDSTANLFYVDFERSVPTLYSTMMLFVCALLFGAIAVGHRRGGHPYVGHWGVPMSLWTEDMVQELDMATEFNDQIYDTGLNNPARSAPDAVRELIGRIARYQHP